MSLATLLAERDAVVDGGLATELESRGHDLRDSLWSARLLRDDPQSIEDVHAAYFAAGADVAITSSYHATLEGFEAHGIDREEGRRLLRLSVEVARRARDRTGGKGLVAGSVGLYGVVWANGTEYTGDYARATDDEIATTQRSRMIELVAAGADLLAFETIPNAREAAIISDLLVEVPGVEAWVSFCCRDDGHTSDGTPIGDAIRAADRSGRVAAFGINCTPPQHIDGLLAQARRATDLPLIVYPNHGRVWDGSTYTWSGDGVDAFSAETMARWRRLGARAIGGCCGIGPAAIAAVSRSLRR